MLINARKHIILIKFMWQVNMNLFAEAYKLRGFQLDSESLCLINF